MPIRIIDSKKVDMTDDEYKMYERICMSYDDPPHQKGRDLFIDLFEVDEQGLILFLKPPNKRACSLEIFLFMMSVMQNQHIRNMYKQVNDALARVNAKLKELNK